MNNRKQRHIERKVKELSMNTFPYRCRGSFVLVRVVDIGITESGIAMPNSAAQGKEFHVVSAGPDVKDLQTGEKVLMVGTKNTHYFEVPHASKLIIIKDEYCVLVDRPYGVLRADTPLEASEGK